MAVPRTLLPRALLANAVVVLVPALALVGAWVPDLVEMGMLGVVLVALVLAPAGVVAAASAFLARYVGHTANSRWAAVAAALLGATQFVMAFVGLAESTGAVESACFIAIALSAVVVSVTGGMASLRSASSPLRSERRAHHPAGISTDPD